MRKITLTLAVSLLAATLLGCEGKQSGLPKHILDATPLPLPQRPDAIAPESKTYLVGSKAMTEEATTSVAATNVQLQKASARTLAQLGSRTTPTLVQLLNGGTPDEQLQAAAALAWMGPEAVGATEALVLKLESPATPRELQVACVRAIGEIGPAIWPTMPTRPKAEFSRVRPQLEPAGAGQPAPLDPAEEKWQADQRAYQADMAEYQRQMQLAQRAVAAVARILREQANS